MPGRVSRPLAAMGVEHGHRAPAEGLAPARAQAILQAWRPTAPERTADNRGVLVKGRAAHGRDRQADMPRDAPRLEGLAPLAPPVVDMDFGAPSAQRRVAAHGHLVRALATPQAAGRHLAHLLGLPAREQLGHQPIIIGGLIAWLGVRQWLPVIGKNLLEDPPGPGGCCQHTGAPR